MLTWRCSLTTLQYPPVRPLSVPFIRRRLPPVLFSLLRHTKGPASARLTDNRRQAVEYTTYSSPNVTAGHGSLRSVNRGRDLGGVGGLAWPAWLGQALPAASTTTTPADTGKSSFLHPFNIDAVERVTNGLQLAVDLAGP